MGVCLALLDQKAGIPSRLGCSAPMADVSGRCRASTMPGWAATTQGIAFLLSRDQRIHKARLSLVPRGTGNSLSNKDLGPRYRRAISLILDRVPDFATLNAMLSTALGDQQGDTTISDFDTNAG
jgi:hypothetical protein